MEESTFKAFNFILSWGGVRIFAKYNKRRKLWFSLQIFNFIIGFLALVFTCGFVIENVSDLLLLLRGACIWGTCVILTMTLGIFLVYQKDMKTYLQYLAVDDAILEMPLINYLLQHECFSMGGKLIELKNLVAKSQEKLSRFTRVLLMSYSLVIFVTASLYLCDTIYEMVKRDDESLRLFAFDMWFPWSVEDFNVYVITFIGHVYAAYLCICAYAGFQTTVILLVGQVVRQVRIMTFILLNLRSLAKEMHALTGHDSDDYCTSVLIQCVQHFIRLKKFCNKLAGICRPLYLALLFVATVIVCMSSVKIAISNKFSQETMKYYVHGCAFILVILMFSMLAQKLDDEVALMEDALLEKWYLYDKRHKTDVKIFKIALRRGMHTYLFGSATLSRASFTWFIKNGMSFFTLVMSFVDEAA